MPCEAVTKPYYSASFSGRTPVRGTWTVIRYFLTSIIDFVLVIVSGPYVRPKCSILMVTHRQLIQISCLAHALFMPIGVWSQRRRTFVSSAATNPDWILSHAHISFLSQLAVYYLTRALHLRNPSRNTLLAHAPTRGESIKCLRPPKSYGKTIAMTPIPTQLIRCLANKHHVALPPYVRVQVQGASTPKPTTGRCDSSFVRR